MTQILFENPELDKERQKKLKDGYVLLGHAPPDADLDEFWERFFFIEDEALAAGLLWEKDFSAISVRDMGVTEKGDKFLIRGGYSSGLKPDFYVKPGMLQDVLGYLDSAPEAIEVRSIRETQERKTLKEAEERKFRIDKESDLDVRGEKEKSDSVPSAVKIQKPKLEQDDPVAHKADHSSRRKEKERPGPSVIAIFLGIAALFLLGVTKVFFEANNGVGSADFFLEPILILIFVGIPIFLVLRYTFKEGTELAGYRFRGLVVGVAIFLFFIWLVSLLDGGGSDCFYIVGCI